MSVKDVRLTTADNPWDPWDNETEWRALDLQLAVVQDRPTCDGYVASIAKSSAELSPELQTEAIEDAVDWIVANDPSTVWKKVEKNI
jgi:hypothetical protein